MIEEKEEVEPKAKRVRSNEIERSKEKEKEKEKEKGKGKEKYSTKPRRIESGILSKIPPELFPHILKFLSSEVNFRFSSLSIFFVIIFLFY